MGYSFDVSRLSSELENVSKNENLVLLLSPRKKKIVQFIFIVQNSPEQGGGKHQELPGNPGRLLGKCFSSLHIIQLLKKF